VPKAAGSGQLVSIDAVRGCDLVSCAKRLLQVDGARTRDGGFSTFDASSIFFDLAGVRDTVEQPASPQTLLLLFAADLRFRLRWQIEPALAERQTVVAAPYIETGMAFGLAFGVSRRWLTELFRFAPKPAASFWVDKGPSHKQSPSSGFLEFCSADLPIQEPFLSHFAAYFTELERRGKCRRLS